MLGLYSYGPGFKLSTLQLIGIFSGFPEFNALTVLYILKHYFFFQSHIYWFIRIGPEKPMKWSIKFTYIPTNLQTAHQVLGEFAKVKVGIFF